MELRRTRRSWPRGRWRFRKTGWSESIAPTTRANWRRYAAASRAGGRRAERNGRNGLPSVSAWNRRTARRVGRAWRGGRGGQRLVTAHVCLPLLPISDLSRFRFPAAKAAAKLNCRGNFSWASRLGHGLADQVVSQPVDPDFPAHHLRALPTKVVHLQTDLNVPRIL